MVYEVESASTNMFATAGFGGGIPRTSTEALNTVGARRNTTRRFA